MNSENVETSVYRTTPTTDGFDGFPPVHFRSYLLVGNDCIVVHTVSPTWCALLQRHCDGELRSPDGRTWRRLATFLLNGVAKALPEIGYMIQPKGAPWDFKDWPEDIDKILY